MPMWKKIFMSVFLVCSLLAVTGCGEEAAEGPRQEGGYQKIKLVMSVNGTNIATDTKVAMKFAELVSQESGGNITVDVFPNDQLAGGNASKGIEMIADGAVDLAAYATSVMAVMDEHLLIATIPWTFNNYQEAREIIDTTGGEYYKKILAAQGMTFLASVHNGFRQITNDKHPVIVPEDVAGLKIRVPGGEVYFKFWRAFGADPVAMSWSETFTAIQQGTIDGQENGFSVTNSAKVNEIQKYMTVWNYTYEIICSSPTPRFLRASNPRRRSLSAPKPKRLASGDATLSRTTKKN